MYFPVLAGVFAMAGLAFSLLCRVLGYVIQLVVDWFFNSPSVSQVR
jgi:hypothetical protein